MVELLRTCAWLTATVTIALHLAACGKLSAGSEADGAPDAALEGSPGAEASPEEACPPGSDSTHQSFHPQCSLCPTGDGGDGAETVCRGVCMGVLTGAQDGEHASACHCGAVSYEDGKHTGPGPCAADEECCRGGVSPSGYALEDHCVPIGNCVDCRPASSGNPLVRTDCCYDDATPSAPPRACLGECMGGCTCGEVAGGCEPGFECCDSPFHSATCVPWGACPAPPASGTGAGDCEGNAPAPKTYLSCCVGTTCRGACLDEGDAGGAACFCDGPGSCPEGTVCCDFSECSGTPKCVHPESCTFCFH